MYERSYGYKYAEGKDLSTTDIAKLIRSDIKTAVAEGLLPGAPVRYSVTSDYFSGGSSIDVRVLDWPEAWQVCEGVVPGTHRHCGNVWCKGHNDPAYAHGASEHLVLTEEGQAAKMTLQRIHGAYNHDGSESQVDYFDVNYYGQVEIEDRRSMEFRAEERARKAAKRRVLDEAAAVETVRVKVYGDKGRRTVHEAVLAEGRAKPVCGAQLRSWALVDLTTDALTCSRCVKRAAK